MLLCIILIYSAHFASLTDGKLTLLFMSHVFLCVIFYSLAVGCHTISGMHLTDITVPEVVDFRHNIEISCEYNMNGKTLHSVKWYKDNMEFFR